jgi:two-component system sensor histidine kinase CiaH
MRFFTELRTKNTLRLALSYLVIIMLMSISFSVAYYQICWHELGRQLPPNSWYASEPDGDHNYQDFFEGRVAQGRGHLVSELVVLNVAALIGGAAVSYALARMTLRPIEKALETQSRFASDASHELRTPLAAIQSQNEVALRTSKLTLPRSKELLQSNLDEVGKLRTIVEGLLRLAREEHKATKACDPVSLADITTEAMNDVLAAAQVKRISVEDGVLDLIVCGDFQSLRQALVILLDNAIKYSAEDSTIHLSARRRGKYAYVAVQDEGPGIAAADLPHIFERFYRADASRSNLQNPGYGLGLSIAQKIVAQQRGELRVESEPGKGATFIVKLPLAPKAVLQ